MCLSKGHVSVAKSQSRKVGRIRRVSANDVDPDRPLVLLEGRESLVCQTPSQANPCKSMYTVINPPRLLIYTSAFEDCRLPS